MAMNKKLILMMSIGSGTEPQQPVWSPSNQWYIYDFTQPVSQVVRICNEGHHMSQRPPLMEVADLVWSKMSMVQSPPPLICHCQQLTIFQSSLIWIQEYWTILKNILYLKNSIRHSLPQL